MNLQRCVVVPVSGALASLIIAMSVVFNVKAQEQQANGDRSTYPASSGDVLEEIVVSGIRLSEKRALSIRRDADGIVDAISAEDLGKFPDSNISESLQRIPGVTIERQGGEGRFVSVRGLDKNDTAVLLNGRVLATENDGREFSFDVLASELINGATVHKTPTAGLLEGGIGGTVNLITARPLNYSGLKGAASVKLLNEEASGKTSPQFSGLISNTFADDTVGILASLNYTEREFRTERAYTDGFEPNANLDFNNDGINEYEGVAFPSYYTQDIDQSTRERIGGTLVFQYRPSDDVTVTIDGLYSKLDVNSDTVGIALYVPPSAVAAATVDANNTVTEFVTEPGARPTEYVAFSRPRFAETSQIGINLDWSFSENLDVVFDASYSDSEDTIAGDQSYFVGYQENPDRAVTVTTNGDGVFTHSNLGDLSRTDNIKPTFFTFEGRNIGDTASQATVDATYRFESSEIIDSIQAGFAFTDRKKSRDEFKTPDNLQCIYCGTVNGYVPSNIVNVFDAGGFLSGEAGSPATFFPSWDQQQWVDYLLSDAGLATLEPENRANAIANIAANGGNFGVVARPSNSGDVSEQTTGVYVQLNMKGEVADMPWSGNVGLRYASTDITARGTAQTVLAITPIPGTNEAEVTFSEPVAVQESGSYDVFLPSANVKLDMQEDLIMRAAIGKSITRGTLGDLLLNTNYNVRERERNVTSGNPSLKPTIAWNYDLTLSWYIDDISYLSGSVFYKDLQDKAERETNTIQILGFDFLSNRPQNKAEGEVAGFELSGQYAFENGFGFKLNYTDTTNTSIDPSGPDFDLDAKSFNVVGFYDKGSIQARLAYSFRDEYLESRAANRGQPRTFASYGQWDASASYEFSENFLLFVEGTNLTNERTRQFSKFSERLIELKDTGRRFAVGMRMSF